MVAILCAFNPTLFGILAKNIPCIISAQPIKLLVRKYNRVDRDNPVWTNPDRLQHWGEIVS